VTPAGLNLQQAPPFAAPLRFFVTAPVFALLAALLALWQGPELFDSRWSPATLAATHLLTLGFAGMTMVGATMQILPVLAGAPLPYPGPVASVVHATLTLGTLALAAGLFFSEPALLTSATLLLAAAFGVFLAALAASLMRVALVNETINMLRYSTLALAVTVALGLWLAAGRAGIAAFPDASLRDLHPGWGFAGWWALLLAALARQVVPMFQMTPPYPAWMGRRLAVGMLAALLAWSLASWAGWAAVAAAAVAVLAVLYAAFSGATLWLQQKRRRRQPDATVFFWRIAMLCALGAALGWALPWSSSLGVPAAPVALGVAVIAGAAMSAINGMLYKIVPFLAWFHLQARSGMGRQVPHVRQYVTERGQWRHAWLHAASVALLLAAAAMPKVFAHAAAAVFALSALQLAANLAHMLRVYRQAERSSATPRMAKGSSRARG
jgi:hypothetical protein